MAIAIAWGELAELYAKLVGGAALGVVLGRILPAAVPRGVGWFLFWVGVPISCVAFIRQADLSGGALVAVGAAWLAIGIAAISTAIWLLGTPHGRRLNPAERGSLILAALFGNTGYVGFPVILALVGNRAFGWALFFDLFGTT
ncbi:MAG: AEC family transporter [Cyanophyceae cyanobacterium]